MDIIFANLQPATAIALFFASFAGSFVIVVMGIGGGAILLAIMASFVPATVPNPVQGSSSSGPT